MPENGGGMLFGNVGVFLRLHQRYKPETIFDRKVSKLATGEENAHVIVSDSINTHN
jgi:hypothetical protein